MISAPLRQRVLPTPGILFCPEEGAISKAFFKSDFPSLVRILCQRFQKLSQNPVVKETYDVGGVEALRDESLVFKSGCGVCEVWF